MEATLQHEHREREHRDLALEPPHRRVGLVDRIALRVGVALVTWGRRSVAPESHERRANRVEQRLAMLGRERAAERMFYLSSPQR